MPFFFSMQDSILPGLCKKELPLLSVLPHLTAEIALPVLRRAPGRCHGLSAGLPGAGLCTCLPAEIGCLVLSALDMLFVLAHRCYRCLERESRSEPLGILSGQHLYLLKAVHECELGIFAFIQVKYESQNRTRCGQKC